MQNRSRSSSAASLNRTQARTVCVPRPRPTRCGPTRQGWYKGRRHFLFPQNRKLFRIYSFLAPPPEASAATLELLCARCRHPFVVLTSTRSSAGRRSAVQGIWRSSFRGVRTARARPRRPS
uniref:Uncharacterized protein n=1 Tax=Setaria viridis TaxID=4556 RepID=A0A4U6TMW2_SETVI|nr:hypothetical protein SEVIR_8G252270v2 [Setaria viridis]